MNWKRLAEERLQELSSVMKSAKAPATWNEAAITEVYTLNPADFEIFNTFTFAPARFSNAHAQRGGIGWSAKC